MRAIEISLFLIMIQASVVFVNDSGMFASTFAASPHNTYTLYNTSQLTAGIEDPNNLGLLDWFWISVRWIFDSLFIILKVLLGVVVILPWLIYVFHIPAIFAIFMQVGIYVIYWLGYASWKSNRPLEWHT